MRPGIQPAKGRIAGSVPGLGRLLLAIGKIEKSAIEVNIEPIHYLQAFRGLAEMVCGWLEPPLPLPGVAAKKCGLLPFKAWVSRVQEGIHPEIEPSLSRC